MFLSEISSAQSDPISKDSSAIIFADDPIASMLDSLSRVMYFDKSTLEITPNKYHFPIDSVPNYSDSIYAMRLAKLDAESPFDLIYNNAVRSYIELYAVRKRAMVSRMLGMSKMYFPIIEEILDRKKIPLELKYLAIVESALNPMARSRAGAVGLWQFMYGTGKMQGLKISSYLDERSDPYKSTEAACDYLQFLYDMFGDWQMVLAAYNGGPGTVSKAIRRSGGKTTYWEIRPYLPRETQGYVPAFIAVNYVMTHWEEHNLYPAVPKITYADIDTVNIKEELSFQQIAKVLNMSVDEIRYLNPCYKRGTVPHSEDNCYSLCLPTEKIGSFIANEAEIYEYAKKDSMMQTLAVQEIAKIHTVRKGETLSKVAKRYGCTPEDVKAWNRLKSAKLHTGQKLTVYIPVKGNSVTASSKTNTAADTSSVVKVKQEVSADTAKTSLPSNAKFKYVVVQKGDSLWSIAQENGVTIEQLKQWNNLEGGKIMPGQKIKILITG
ncbi:MAG: LysM peptidoglycan-binding domain-containing protein [Bacteroidetes bacterium]|nr:LysM peptidoglycan-binding domain-containing protein [Bacteroidota bacterium]